MNVIPSLRSDLIGHADSMVRFVSEPITVGNLPPSQTGLGAQVKRTMRDHGIEMLDFPCACAKENSAVGCYLNFLDTKDKRDAVLGRFRY